MPRIGMNPARGQMSDYHPSRVTLAMLSHIPDMSGYFQNRFDVMRLSLESLIANTPGYDVLVFDNGSCPPVVDYLRTLRDAGKINYLLLSSRNVGKIGAFQILFRAAPGEIIAYNDDDILFLPGWLKKSLGILDTYPKVGMVSGYYVRSHMLHGIQTTQEFSKQEDAHAQRGQLYAREWEKLYIENYGRTWEKYQEEIKGVEDVLMSYKMVDAYVSAQHMQFLIPKQVILDALPKKWGGQLMGQMKELDTAVDNLGYLRLSTPEPVTRFLGNGIGADMAELAKSMGLSASASPERKKPGKFLTRIYRNPTIHYLAQGLYNNLYTIINA